VNTDLMDNLYSDDDNFENQIDIYDDEFNEDDLIN